MTVVAQVKNQTMKKTEDMMSFFRVLTSFVKKSNPIMTVYQNIYVALRDLLTINTKLKIAKYRVNHMKYRLNQMEQLIETNSSDQLSFGNSMDITR